MLKLLGWIQEKLMVPLIGRMDQWEERIVAMPEVHRSAADSPVRFEIMKEGMKRERGGPGQDAAHLMPPTILGMRRSMVSLRKNPKQPKMCVPEGFLVDLERYARSLGTSSIGYAQVPERWIFRGKGILHLNAIMLTMEMDKVRIDTAPSVDGLQAVIEIYRDLGIVANKVATYLRKRGYSAHAAHPLMGPALYPPLTQLAGLGWLSVSGLIVTPEHGPRVRLAAVFTNIENLPFSIHNDHAWVEDFCAVCGICIRQCPAEAILPEPVHHENGQITCVINPRCFPYFGDNYGCSVCIKVCPFNNTSYDRIKDSFERKKDASAFLQQCHYSWMKYGQK
jgi:NAD-dependent dihydropyrimidine dehydrogenase PreA subunit